MDSSRATPALTTIVSLHLAKRTDMNLCTIPETGELKNLEPDLVQKED